MKNSIYNQLVQTLRLLASPVEVQLSLFPQFVDIPDEIALLFDDSYNQLAQLKEERVISKKTILMMSKLNELFDNMSNNKSLWNIKSLKEDKHWHESRYLALQLLKGLKEEYVEPNIDFVKWIK